MHLENGGLLTWRYKHIHDFLMRHFFDVHFYYFIMYFKDIYYVVMIFGRIHTRKWDPEILFPNGMGWRAQAMAPWDIFCPIDFKFFGKQAVGEMNYPLNKMILIR